MNVIFLNDYFPYLKYRLLTTTKEELKHIHLVDEGLENTMLHAITYSHSMEEFINRLLSKRYTLPRIQRMIIHVLMNNQKDEIKQAMNIDYLRILAMNDQGRHYLSSIKKTCSYHIVTNLSKFSHPALDIEIKATKLLSLLSKDSEKIIKKEYAHIPYIKAN